MRDGEGSKDPSLVEEFDPCEVCGPGLESDGGGEHLAKIGFKVERARSDVEVARDDADPEREASGLTERVDVGAEVRFLGRRARREEEEEEEEEGGSGAWFERERRGRVGRV